MIRWGARVIRSRTHLSRDLIRGQLYYYTAVLLFGRPLESPVNSSIWSAPVFTITTLDGDSGKLKGSAVYITIGHMEI